MVHHKKMKAVKELDKQRDDRIVQEEKDQAEEFLYCLQHEWSFKVTRLARNVLKQKQAARQNHMPKPSDMKKLSEFIVKFLKEADITDTSWENFQKNEKFAESRLGTYNKRRSGEVEGTK